MRSCMRGGIIRYFPAAQADRLALMRLYQNPEFGAEPKKVH